MRSTVQEFLNGGIQSGTIDVWDNQQKAWRTAGQWKLVREPLSGTPAGTPLVTFDFEYAPGYDGPSVSPDLPPPQKHSSVLAIKNQPKGASEARVQVFDAELPAIFRQLTAGDNMKIAHEAKLAGRWQMREDSLPAIAGAEHLVMNGGFTLAGMRMTVKDEPMNYLPIIGARAITQEADELVDVATRGDIISKIDFYADQKRNSFAHTALGGATPKFLGYNNGTVLVVKPVSAERHVDTVVEHLMQKAQRAAKIDAASTTIYQTPKGNTAMLSGHYGYVEPKARDGASMPDFTVRRTACSMAALTGIFNNDNSKQVSTTYRPMVEAIHKFSADPRRDREELARRAIFHLMVNNMDNHLGQTELFRNERNEWALAPSYDVAPTTYGRRQEFKTTFGGMKSQHEIGTLNNAVLWRALGKDFADERGVPMPEGQLKAMAVDVAKAVLSVPGMMQKANIPESTIREFERETFWPKEDLLAFVKENEGKTQQKDQQYSLSPR